MLGVIFAGVINTGLGCLFSAFRIVDITLIILFIFANSMLDDCLPFFPRWMESQSQSGGRRFGEQTHDEFLEWTVTPATCVHPRFGMGRRNACTWPYYSWNPSYQCQWTHPSSQPLGGFDNLWWPCQTWRFCCLFVGGCSFEPRDIFTAKWVWPSEIYSRSRGR